MEEILASIRRIISDEVAAEPQPARSEGQRTQAAPAPVAHPELDAVETTASVESANAAEAQGSASQPEDTDVHRPIDVYRSSVRHTSTPRPSANPSSYAPLGRAPAADPFSANRRLAAASALSVPEMRAEPVSVPATRAPAAGVEASLAVLATINADDDADLDASLSAALLDLSLVEQAVQAELATMTADTAIDETDVATTSAHPVEALSSESGDVLTSSTYDHHPAEASAVAPQAPSAPETDDMQVQAKPAPVTSRAAAEPAEERRGPETRVHEAARSEPRFLAAGARPTEAPTVAAAQPEPSSRLVSTATNSAVSTAFGTLARTVASNSRTVDDLVTEAMKPMLKAWLDENLPALVERLVRAEIERVARQGQ